MRSRPVDRRPAATSATAASSGTIVWPMSLTSVTERRRAGGDHQVERGTRRCPPPRPRPSASCAGGRSAPVDHRPLAARSEPSPPPDARLAPTMTATDLAPGELQRGPAVGRRARRDALAAGRPWPAPADRRPAPLPHPAGPGASGRPGDPHRPPAWASPSAAGTSAPAARAAPPRSRCCRAGSGWPPSGSAPPTSSSARSSARARASSPRSWSPSSSAAATRCRPSRSASCGGSSRRTSAGRSRRCSSASTPSRWPPRRSPRCTAPRCAPARTSW